MRSRMVQILTSGYMLASEAEGRTSPHSHVLQDETVDWDEVVYVFRSPEPEGIMLNAMMVSPCPDPCSLFSQGVLGTGRGGVPSV